MKNTFKFLSWAFVILLATVSLASCGDDDDDNKNGNGGSGTNGSVTTLVGTWRSYFGGDGSYMQMTFREDGTGVYVEIDKSSNSYSDDFVYSYEPPKLTVYWLEDGDVEETNVVFQSGNQFKATLVDEDECVWTRQ